MNTRDKILNAAKEIIAKEGFAAATIANILKKASTGYGALYNYFESKEDLYKVLYQDILLRSGKYILNGYSNEDNVSIQLKSILTRYLEYCWENTNDFYLLEAFNAMPEMYKKVNDASDGGLQDKFKEVMKQCANEGSIKQRDVCYNINLAFGIIASSIKYNYMTGKQMTNDLKEDIIHSCVNALK